MTLELRDYQKEAMKKIISIPKSLICIKTGKGKTLSAIFACRYLLKHDMVDKVVFSGTKTSINSFVKAFRTQLNVDVKVIEKGEPIFMRLKPEEEVEYIKEASDIDKSAKNKELYMQLASILRRKGIKDVSGK